MGLSRDTEFVWYAQGGQLKVCSTKYSRTVGSFCFGTLNRDESTEIKCVEELVLESAKDGLLLVIGAHNQMGSIIYVFYACLSRVVLAFQLNEKVLYKIFISVLLQQCRKQFYNIS